ncbi:MAG TPA: oxidoreductase [Candidatus Acidoferrales bacterium]|nr:oxidoreductase [Candidatus Acidoferrales bacterium]
MIRVGLIGYGLGGESFHAPTIRCTPGLELACIVSPSGTRRNFPAGVRVGRSVHEMLSDESLRLCVVTSPNQFHFEHARLCLEAGRDTVVDKPFTITSEDARQLIGIARERGRLLSVFHNRRWDGEFSTLQELISSGSLGRIVEVESRYDRFRPALKPDAWREKPEPGAGVLYDLSPHLSDQIFALFGEPEAVTATVSALRDNARADDSFDIRLHYPRMQARLRATMLACAPGPRWIVHGTRGSFIKYGMDPQEAPLRRGEMYDSPNWGEEPEESWGTLSAADGDSVRTEEIKTDRGDYRGYYENVRDAILRAMPLAVTAEDGLRTIRAIELARESSATGRTIAW